MGTILLGFGISVTVFWFGIDNQYRYSIGIVISIAIGIGLGSNVGHIQQKRCRQRWSLDNCSLFLPILSFDFLNVDIRVSLNHQEISPAKPHRYTPSPNMSVGSKDTFFLRLWSKGCYQAIAIRRLRLQSGTLAFFQIILNNTWQNQVSSL